MQQQEQRQNKTQKLNVLCFTRWESFKMPAFA
jgi:hypothetical protein